MAMKVATLDTLDDFLKGCTALFASQDLVTENDTDINTYVLNIDYEKDLAFDTSDTSETLPDDI